MLRIFSNTGAAIIGVYLASSVLHSRCVTSFRLDSAGTGQVCFVQHSLTGNDFQIVPWSEVAAQFMDLANDDAPPASVAPDGPVFGHLPARQFVRRLAYRLSPSLRASISDALVTQGKALRAWGRLINVLLRATLAGWRRSLPKLVAGYRRSEMQSAARFTDVASRGDIVLLLGATWSHPDYSGLIDRVCKANGLRFVLLVHDLIPVRCPEWCDRVLL